MLERLLAQLDLATPQGFRRYFANTAWLLVGRAAQLVLALVVGTWMTAYLGPERYGVYAFALSLATLFAPLANLGLGQIIVREIVAAEAHSERIGGPATTERQEEYRILGTALGIRLLGTVVAYAGLGLVLAFAVQALETLWAVMLAASAISLRSIQILIFYFQARVQAKKAAIPQLIGLVASNGLKVYFILTGAPMMAFLYAVLVDALLYSLLLWTFYRMEGGRLGQWRWETPRARYILSRSWPLMFTLFLFTVYMQIDQVMIRYMLGFESVGYYGAAVRLSTAAYVMPWVLSNSLFPAILRSARNNRPMFLRRMQGFYRLLIGSALVLIVLVWALGEDLVLLVYGQAFAAAIPVLTLHIVASLFVFIGYAAEKWQIAEDRQRYTFYGVGLGSLLNIVLNLILVPRYGIIGAAWATLVAQAFSYHLAFGLFRATRELFAVQNHAMLDVLTLRFLWKRR